MPRSPRLFVYRPAPSDGAKALVVALRDLGLPARKITRRPRRILPGDAFIGWGGCFDTPPGTPALNWTPPTGKVTELAMLIAASVPTVAYTTRHPATYRGDGDWLGRSYSHHGGDDLLNPDLVPQFWVFREDVSREFRVHVWGGVSARVGLKVANDDQAHPWIRSRAAGWRLDYGEGARQVRQKHRDAAKAAVAALHLDFAAVDIGERPDGSVFVFEANRAPGMDGTTTAKYAEKVRDWYAQAQQG